MPDSKLAVQVEGLLQQAQRESRRGNHDGAADLAQRALRLDPDNKAAARYVSPALNPGLRTHINDLLKQAQSAASAGNQLRAATLAQKVLQLEPANQDALSYATPEGRQAHIDDLLQQTREAMASGNWERTGVLVHRVLPLDPGNVQANMAQEWWLSNRPKPRTLGSTYMGPCGWHMVFALWLICLYFDFRAYMVGTTQGWNAIFMPARPGHYGRGSHTFAHPTIYMFEMLTAICIILPIAMVIRLCIYVQNNR